MTTVSAVNVITTASFAAPNDAARTNLLVDYDWGGATLTSAEGGPRAQQWIVSYFGGAVRARPVSGGDWAVLRTIANVSEVSVSWDYFTRPVLAYVQGGVAYVSWYTHEDATWRDVALGTNARGPMLGQAFPSDGAISDITVVCAYLRNGNLCVRESTTNYTEERVLTAAPFASTRITRIGMSTDDRFLIELDGEGKAATTATQDILTDQLYAAIGDKVLPLFETGRRIGVWRTKKLVMDHHPVFAWLRLEGPFSSAKVRIYGDGSLYYTTPEITNNMPVRLPPGRFREIDVEVESADRVTGVVLSHTSDEMRRA